MDLETANLQRIIEKEVKLFEGEVKGELKKALSAHKDTGKLENSVQIILDQAKDHFQFNFRVFFEDYGKIIQKNERFHFRSAKTAPANLLAEWVKRVGVSNFAFVPGRDSTKMSDDNKAIAIAMGMKFSTKRFRPQRQGFYGNSWFYRNFFGTWKEHREKIFEAYFGELPTTLADVVEKELNK